MEPQHHQRDVLRHPLALQRIDGTHDGEIRRNVRRGEEIVDPGAGAGDELERRKPRRDACSELEREHRFDFAGRGSVRIRVNPLIRRKQRKRRALLLDERRRVENENGQGREGRERRRTAATLHA